MGVYSLPDELRPSQPPPSPSQLVLQAEPGGILGSPCVANPLEELGCLIGEGGEGSNSKVGIGAARVHAVQAHICPDTRTPTPRHTHAYLQLPSRPSCLNFPLFPRASPRPLARRSLARRHSPGCREQRERTPYKPVPALLPISSPQGLKFIEMQGRGVAGGCSESEEVASRD